MQDQAVGRCTQCKRRCRRKQPGDLVDRLEKGVDLPAGSEERIRGCGGMGLPFTSGHVPVPALGRFPNASIGPGTTSVWHRRPDDGKRVFVWDTQLQVACSRYFGSAVNRVLEGKIRSDPLP